MSNLIQVQVYQINRLPQPVGGVTRLIELAQINNVAAVTGTPTTVNGSFVYSVINMAGNTQYPGTQFFTGLTVYQVTQLTGYL